MRPLPSRASKRRHGFTPARKCHSRNLLVHQGRTFSIGTMKQVRFVDTTLRDGQQSLWAYGMRTGMIVPIAKHMDDAGFEAIELGGPVELPKCVRELREDPWERYRLVLSRIKKTPVRGIHR